MTRVIIDVTAIDGTIKTRTSDLSKIPKGYVKIGTGLYYTVGLLGEQIHIREQTADDKLNDSRLKEMLL